MASVFQKPDPKDAGTKRWMGKVKVGDDWRTFSLRLKALPGTKREAQTRVDSLQVEIKAGVLSDSTKAWLGDVAVAKLEMEMGRRSANIQEGGYDSWNAAGQAWLKACEPRDTRQKPEGRAKMEQKTKKSRKYKLKSFLDWVTAQKIAFLKEPFTETAKRYIAYRQEQGISSNTMWNADFSTICTWGEWMASKRICEPVNRDAIREVMPGRPDPEISLPTWKDDLAAIRFFHMIRRYGDWAKPLEGRNRWKMLKSHQSVWSVVLIVRGLGCRPSEATALDWSTVDIPNNKVRFIRSKNGKTRTVPILFQWVRDGLEELWEWRGRPKAGAVCVNFRGEIWKEDCNVSDLMRRIALVHGRTLIHLKDMEKLQIAQLIRLGFPPHVVAHWSDHTLSVQERPYYEGDSYLPPEDGYDFEEFGALSDYGKKVLFHQGAYSREMSIE
jgi:integrase